MTDLEMTKLCAEAMGHQPLKHGTKIPVLCWLDDKSAGFDYAPLHDDAQAMALVKRFLMVIDFVPGHPQGNWVACSQRGVVREATSPDLNRAIVECVAKMQRAKKP